MDYQNQLQKYYKSTTISRITTVTPEEIEALKMAEGIPVLLYIWGVLCFMAIVVSCILIDNCFGCVCFVLKRFFRSCFNGMRRAVLKLFRPQEQMVAEYRAAADADPEAGLDYPLTTSQVHTHVCMCSMKNPREEARTETPPPTYEEALALQRKEATALQAHAPSFSPSAPPPPALDFELDHEQAPPVPPRPKYYK